MLLVQVKVRCAGVLEMGEVETPALHIQCPLPAPPVRGRIRVRHAITGESRLLKRNMPLPTDHCGQLVCRPDRVAVYDYLGLFRLAVYRKRSASVVVRPVPIPMKHPEKLERRAARSWKPKPGGGFAENHELRLYRPGDSLNQVHWKLTAKTGKLVIREAMEPRQGRILLVMALQGSAEELDRKFGRLRWMGTYLLQQGLHYELCVSTGRGLQTLPVYDETALLHAIDLLLSLPQAAQDAPVPEVSAAWQLCIGGDADEV